MISLLQEAIELVDITFGQWLTLRRRELKLNQVELGEALGVSRTTISNWETEVSQPSLTLPQVKALCEALQCSLLDIPNPKTDRPSPNP